MLSTKQIDQLFEFCKKHFVPYYDVQVELVDHLANAIEEQMSSNPNLSFQKALENVHQSFGVSGFAPLVAEKRKMAEKQGRSLFWELFKKHFGWPKILLFLLIVSFAFTLFSLNPFLFQIFYISVVIGCLMLVAYGSVKKRKKILSTGKRFLVAEFSHGSSFFLFLFYIIMFPNIFDKDFPPTLHGNFSILFSSIVIGILVITAIVDLQVLASLNDKLKKEYPQVFVKA
ncbi:MAG TPA: hypothetical protein VLS85_04505 [Hanamia sp.]|nr:hypothetical protein [Hanamia sp.]